MTSAIFPADLTSYETLFAYLRSPEGGGLLIRESEDNPLAIIYYSKATSNMANPSTGFCRSIIYDKSANKILCIAPPRGLPFTAAIDAGLPANSFLTEEFIDGTMINQFHDGARWRLATRTQIDATNNFFGKRPYADLFAEAFAAAGLKEALLVPGQTYSWVLQSAEERIVVAPPYGISRLFLVATTAADLPAQLTALRPKIYPCKTLEDVAQIVAIEGAAKKHQFQGLVLKLADGLRYKLRSNEYCEARYLRGNQAKRSYHWLDLWSKGLLYKYLAIYPEESCDADLLVNRFKAETQAVHDLYLRVYRKKELRLGDAPQKYRKLLWDAHKEGKGAYFPHLKEFMNEQDTARKLWLLNYEVRYPAAATPAAVEESKEEVTA
jgi:hypothetical protein